MQLELRTQRWVQFAWVLGLFCKAGSRKLSLGPFYLTTESQNPQYPHSPRTSAGRTPDPSSAPCPLRKYLLSTYLEHARHCPKNWDCSSELDTESQLS